MAEDNPINQKVICAMLRPRRLGRHPGGQRQGGVPAVPGAGLRPDADGHPDAGNGRSGSRPPDSPGRGRPRVGPNPDCGVDRPRQSKAHKQEFLAHGMDAVITKPVNMPTILSSIDAVLRSFGRPVSRTNRTLFLCEPQGVRRGGAFRRGLRLRRSARVRLRAYRAASCLWRRRSRI